MQHRLLLSRLLAANTTLPPSSHLIHSHHSVPSPFFLRRTTFHTTSAHHLEDSGETHYTTLESTPTASQAHLKKQFYALSKKNHPDLHRDDISASHRFIRISTAWSILGNEAKRAQYDRELFRANPALFGSSVSAGDQPHGTRGGGPMPSGSHSSAQAAAAAAAAAAPWGARPASGLSRRRGAFRGPPPSFYRSGGWGGFGEKRRAAAEETEEAARRSADGGGDGSAAGSKGGGFAPGQGRDHADFEVPHFDREGHFRRQESVEEALKRRRSVWEEREAAEREAEISGTWARIGIVSMSLIMTGLVTVAWEWRSERKKRKGEH